MAEAIHIYTDGAARGNPGPGGYGVVMMLDKHRKEFAQGYRLTTNNRMELLGVIAAMEALKKEGLHAIIHTDSKYIVDPVQKGWLNTWIKTNFKGGKKNSDLWIRYNGLAKKHHLSFKWDKGHAENVFNPRCDELATEAADGHHLLVDEGYEETKN